MNITPPHDNQLPSPFPNNPTNKQRHEMLRQSLIRAGRPEDYEYIVENLSPPPDITAYGTPGQYKGIKVGIVGAGVAGLCVAFELRKLGFDITIFEAEEERIGGRIYTHYFDADKKFYGELGALQVPASHETTWHYTNLFNLSTSRIFQGKDNTFVYVRGVRARNNSKDIMEKIYPLFDLTPSERNTPWPELYEQVIETIIKSFSPELRAEGLQIKPQFAPQFLCAFVKSVHQGLIDAGLSAAAIDLITSLRPTVNAFIDASFYTEFVTEYTVSTENTYTIDGGMVNLPLAFYRSLTSENPEEYTVPISALGKVAFRMGSYVGWCYKSDKDRKVILKYITKSNHEGIYEAFDYVFFTIPATASRKLLLYPPFSPITMEAIREGNYVDAQKTIFLCNERFWKKEGISGGVSNTDLIIQSVIYPPDHPDFKQNDANINVISNLSEPGVLTASYNIGNDAIRLGNTNTYSFELIKRDVELIHGLPLNYLDKVVMDCKTICWNRNQWVSGAFVSISRGQGALFAYHINRPDYENMVYFAGEAYFPPNGWIQASLRSAMISSNALAYYLKTYGQK